MENQSNSNSINPKLAEALAKCQGQIEAAEKSQKNEAFKRDGKASKYADIADVIEAIKKPCSDNGLSTSFNYKTEVTDQGQIRNFIQYKLRHSSGEFELSDWVLMLSRDQSQHGWGGANTYYRRQMLKGIFQIPEEDDDGNAGSGVTQQRQQMPPPRNNQPMQKALDKAPAKPKNHAPVASNPPDESDDLDKALDKPPMTTLEKIYAIVDERGWSPEIAKEKIRLCLGTSKSTSQFTPEDSEKFYKYLTMTSK